MMNRLSLLTRLAGLVGYRMWQKFPEEFFYTMLTPPETDELVMSLVKSGAVSPDARDQHGNTLLFLTVQKVYAYPQHSAYYVGFARELAAAGAHVDTRTDSRDTPLNAALSHTPASYELVKTLLDLGAYAGRMTRRKPTPLQLAVNASRPDIVRLLIEAGADANVGDPLTTAVMNRDKNTARLLLEAGARPTEALVRLINTSEPDMRLVRLLLAYGADAGRVLVNLSIRRLTDKQLINRTKLLLKAGADINATPGGRRHIQDSQTILHQAVFTQGNRNGYIDMLIAEGADVNVWDRDGYTPLMCACVMQKRDVVRTLLDAGAEVNVREKHGKTALWFAAGKDDLDTVSLLLAKGADPNIADEYGSTPLMKAILSHTDSEFVYALIEGGADPNLVNAAGDTALTLALARRAQCSGIALSLVFAGADPSFVRVKGTGKREMGVRGVRQGFDGETALMILARHFNGWDSAVIAAMCMLRYNPDTKEMDDLEAVPAFVNAQDPNGDTALIKAVRDNRSRGLSKRELVSTLLQAGCDKDIVNNEGKKAIDYETTRDIIKMLG